MGIRYFIFALLALVCMGMGSTHAWAKAAGHFTLVEGRVDVLKKGADKALPVKLGEAVKVGDIVRTKSKSRAQITLVDKSQLNLSESSRIEIRRFVFSGGKNKKRDGMFHVFRGQLRSIVHRSKDDQAFNFKVETPTAVAAVRGTDWYSIVSSDALSSFICKSGTVEIKNIDPKITQTVVIVANQFTRVSKGKAPAAPMKVSPAGLKNMVETSSEEPPAADESDAGGETSSTEAGNETSGTSEDESSSDESSGTDESGGSGESDSSDSSSSTSGVKNKVSSKASKGASVTKKGVAAKVLNAIKTNATSVGQTTTAPEATVVTPPITTTAPQILTAPVNVQINF